MNGTPDPTRIYVATAAYYSPAAANGVTVGMKLRGDHPIVMEHPEWWIDSANDPDTAAIAAAVVMQMRGSEPAAAPRRGPGRPPWTRERFWVAYRAALAELGADPADKEIATKFGFGTKQLGRLVARFGRPAE